tara:strand:- start:1104 stop:1448 length:345 start_codon:yes stop_codon:yes gene_type:complete
MAAVYVSNIVINAGTDFTQTFTLESSDSNSALNLSSYTVRSQLRKQPSSTNYVNFNCNIINPLGGDISIGLSTSITTSLKPGRYLYDVVITENISNIKTRVIEGMALVREGVTK